MFLDNKTPILSAWSNTLEFLYSSAPVCLQQGIMSLTREQLCWLGSAVSSGS